MSVEIEIEELSVETQEFLRRARAEGTSVDLTEHGEIITRFTPMPHRRRPTKREVAEQFAAFDELAKEIARTWPRGVSAVDAVNDVRRDL